MPARERTARTRLQIALETDGARGVRELDGDQQPPRPMLCGVMREARVVECEPRNGFGRHARVVSTRLVHAFQHVNEAGLAHATGNAKGSPSVMGSPSRSSQA